MKITIEYEGETFTRILSVTDVVALKDSIVDPVDWFLTGQIREKVANSRGKMDDHWRPILDADPKVKTLPAELDARIALIVKRADYKNRGAREAEEEAGREK